MAEYTLANGTVVHERYRIVAPIGRGGMGAVYEAIDERLGHRVALKQTLVEGEVAERAFEREARLLAGLRHPALPVVSDFFAEERGRFLVMQFIPGRSLAEVVQERAGTFPVAQVFDWADALLRALEYLHSRQPPILHRDIKPANLKLTTDGEIVLLDFGLAKGSGETTSSGPSVYGLTPQFAPLEQFQGSGTDARSDLYALGGTLHFLLTREPPADALTRASAVGLGKPDPLKPANELSPEVPPRVAALLVKALALHQEDRVASAAAMRRELAEIRSGITDRQPPTLPLPAPVALPTTRVGATPTRGASATLREGEPGAQKERKSRLGGWIAGGLAVAGVLVVGLLAALVVLHRSRPWLAGEAAGVRLVPAEDGKSGFEFQWPGSDLWTLYRGDRKMGVHGGTHSGALSPGRYRIVANDPIFEPVEFSVEDGKKTLLAPPAGTLEFQWPGSDLWTLYVGDRKMSVHGGTQSRALSPGRYRIVANDPIFEPVEFSVEDGKKTLLAPPAGTLEFQWPGSDLWTLYVGDRKMSVHGGTQSRALSPGRYRIVANDPIFEPVEFSVEDGKKTLLAPPAGTLEFQWPGSDLWTLYVGDRKMSVHGGTQSRALSPGRYRIVANDPIFEPVEFSVEDGKKTLLAPPAGTLEFQWPGSDLWTLYRGDQKMGVYAGTHSRALSPGRYRIVPSAPVFKPVDFTVGAGQRSIVRPR